MEQRAGPKKKVGSAYRITSLGMPPLHRTEAVNMFPQSWPLCSPSSLPPSPFLLSLRLPNDIKLAANKSRQRPTELPCPMQDAASSVHGTRNIAVITTYKKFQQSSALSLPLLLYLSLSLSLNIAITLLHLIVASIS